ncbi:hypothetical protein Glove_543g56 [Diversispora epigaea]|uniref:Zinc-ribbon domain-containing protein n=1 Tax=Diversispora epigaea TaxID=1348612 RepID=A0A397GEY5_9GLOM|nr:hypothetical protein Glove_543g56 [Diversispora epigaea]
MVYSVGQHPFHNEIAKKIAIDRGGLCLSTQCTATKELLQWRCSRSHEWSATYNNVIYNKNWCMKCSHRNPCTLENARKIAHYRNGECLSGKFINNELLLLWRCAVGHEWNACLINEVGLENARKIAHGLSEKLICYYYGVWCCTVGHEWNACLSNVKHKNTWCPHCVGGRPRFSLKDVKQIACNRNGECLSPTYFNNYSDLLWKCAKGHTWYALLREVKNQNNWCPFFRLHKRENLCREIVSKYLGSPSKIRRPEFLKTPEHPMKLELDIYYPNYGFAIEVQGQQHEKYTKFFHRGDPNNFIKQERDQLKNELCEEYWIVLRYVWYHQDQYKVIPEHLRELGLIEQT